MRFLIDADLPRFIVSLLADYGHEGIYARDVGLGRAADSEIASYVRRENLCLLTGDFDFSDIRVFPPREYHGLVVLYIPRNATSRYILQLVEEFLQQHQLVDTIEGKLAIVEPGRIRLRNE